MQNETKDSIIKKQAAEIDFLKGRLAKYENMKLNQGNDEIAETQARLSGTRDKISYV
jgi:hypothetical protein